MAWRQRASLAPQEARELHHQALVIDTLFSGVSNVPGAKLHKAFLEMTSQDVAKPYVLGRIAEMGYRELQESQEARQAYLDLWRCAGITAGVHTLVAAHPGEGAYDAALKAIGRSYALSQLLKGKVRIALTADDLEEAHHCQEHALILHFQNSTPFGDDLGRIDLFYNLGVRSVQLTYNLRNLAGDGCTERNAAGLSYFGVEMVRRLNQKRVVVDVSHCSDQVGWDTLEVSTAPISINHTSSRTLFRHDRAKSDDFIKAVAQKGGYIGVTLYPAFIQGGDEATLDSFADHLEHIARMVGVDAVGIGTDIGGIYDNPPDRPWTFEKFFAPGFPWHGFRPEHRLPVRTTVGYRNFVDWPNLTAHLASRGFNEDELRRVLGLNFLRFFRDVVG